VPGFVPEIRDKARIACAEVGGTSVHLYENTVPRSLLMVPGGGIGVRSRGNFSLDIPLYRTSLFIELIEALIGNERAASR
jgi:hypothetical protein